MCDSIYAKFRNRENKFKIEIRAVVLKVGDVCGVKLWGIFPYDRSHLGFGGLKHQGSVFDVGHVLYLDLHIKKMKYFSKPIHSTI